MHQLIEDRRSEIARLCRAYGVRRLEVFGSAIGADFSLVWDVVSNYLPSLLNLLDARLDESATQAADGSASLRV